MTTTKKNYTLEELALKLSGNLWEKAGKRRIYLREGYNTKKMKTTTYVEQLPAGEFNVRCFIDCPSQGWSWIENEQDSVIENVENKIAWIIQETVFVVINNATDKFLDCLAEDCELADAEKFLTKKSAQDFIEDNYLDGNDVTVKEISND